MFRKCLKEFSSSNMVKIEFNDYVCHFSVDYDAIAVDDILNIYNYLMKRYNIV